MYQPASALCEIHGDENREVFALKAALRSALDREHQLRLMMAEQNNTASRLRADVSELRLSLSLAKMELETQSQQRRASTPTASADVAAKSAAMWSTDPEPFSDLEARFKRLRVDSLPV